MKEPVKSRRPYRSPVREERALANRAAILEAARARFLADGYPRSSIAAIATDAGVSEDLVYLLFRTKRHLLVEVLNFSATGKLDSPKVLDQQGPQAVRAEKDQRQQIAMFAADIARRTAATRPIDDVMRSAALVDDTIATKRERLHRTRLENVHQFVGWVATNGPLRAGLTVDTAAATVWALTGADMHRMLVDDLGWSQDQFASWIHLTLEATLLPPIGEPQR